MTHHSTWMRALALVMALGLTLSLGSALAQADTQTDEEQGFFSKLWHYVEYLPVAMEDEEQSFLSSIGRGLQKAAGAVGSALKKGLDFAGDLLVGAAPQPEGPTIAYEPLTPVNP